MLGVSGRGLGAKALERFWDVGFYYALIGCYRLWGLGQSGFSSDSALQGPCLRFAQDCTRILRVQLPKTTLGPHSKRG